MERTITVRGNAKISVSPDYISVVIRLQEKDKDYKKAFNKLQEKVSDIYDCIAECDINKENIKTFDFSASVLKKLEKDKKNNYSEVFDGYMCRQLLSVGFESNAELLGELIFALNKRIKEPEITINFSLRDTSKYSEKLLKMLTADAQNKAKVLCESSNAKVGKLISVDCRYSDISAFSSSNFGDTGELPKLSPSSPTIHSPVLPPRKMISGIMPQEKIVEESAVFVWEITD